MKLKQTKAAKKARRRTITVLVSFLLFVALVVGMGFGISALRTRYLEKKAKEEREASAAAAEAKMDALDHYIADMTLEEKIAQMFLVTPETLTDSAVVTSSGDQVRTALSKYPVGGLLYRSTNMTSEEQTKEMLSSAQKIMTTLSKTPLFLAVTEEGGSNSPVSNSLQLTRFPAAYTYASSETGVEDLNRDMSEMGQELTGLGFNLNLMPYSNCADLSDATIGTRSYGEDYTKTAELVSTVVKGLHGSGLATAMKYFPTSGVQDTSGRLISDKTVTDLETYDMLPFKAGISAETDIVIVGHVQVEALDAGVPADLSSNVIGKLLRTELAYDGIVMTAPLSDAAAGSTKEGQLAVKAVQAGCDMIFGVDDLEESVSAIKEAVSSGLIKEKQIDASVKRILTAKVKRGIMDEPVTTK
ncbi:MAG TPA: glycoside hydrolase family 3 N-terminal domain-containing protein [Clostridiales bacterium]|nr:glycoside hydrolase family 3 N-terminal domain-containing protein [Clostridiales bacterium]